MKGSYLARLVTLIVVVALLALGVGPRLAVLAAPGTTRTVCASGCDYTSIQAAINAAQAGDTIQVKEGTYNEYLSITKSLTLEGEGSDKVTLNATVNGGYGIYIQANSVTVKGLKVAGNTNTYYGIKAEGSSNLTLQNLIVQGYGRSGVDLNGCTNSLVDTVTAQNNNGAGIAVTNSSNITLQNLTTNNNRWGGVALFTASGPYAPGLSNITLTGTNTFGEVNPLYVELASASHTFTNFNQSEFAYIVRSTAAPLLTWYQKDKDTALTFINTANTVNPSFKATAAIQHLSDSTFHVLNTLNIQPAIDLAPPGGTVYVYPGIYNQDEANNRNPDTGGVGTNNFNIFIGKTLTLQGVDANGTPITSYANVAAKIYPKRELPTFGEDAIFVQADNVTIAGLEIFGWGDPNTNENNKTIEVVGNNFTLRACKVHGMNGAAALYMDDRHFDPSTDTSHFEAYTIEGNLFDGGGPDAAGIRISNGVGWSGNVANRRIVDNVFENSIDGIQFVGPHADEWDDYPVGAAIISGNTFRNNGRRHIIAWGEYESGLGYGELDWDAILRSNEFDKAVVVKTSTNAMRTWDCNGCGSVGDIKNIAGIYTSIQRYPINRVAQNGDNILVYPGTYEEQVVVTGKTLTLQGAGDDPSDVVIKSPDTLTVQFTTSEPNKPVVLVQNDANVTLTNLTVDGAGLGNGNDRFMGVAFYNAGGTVENVTVIGVRETPFSGTQHGLAVYAYNQDGTARTLTVRNTTVTDFQKNGITVAGSGLTATIEDNTITGAGATPTIAQNGIQVSYGAAATVRNNTITGIAYSAKGWVSSGILVYGADATTVENNTLTASQANIYVVESSATVRANRISAPACVGDGCYGIIASDPLSARPSPLEEAVVSTALAQPNRSGGFTLLGSTNPLDTVTITANEISGAPYASGESVGLGVYDGGADRDVAVSASQNVITGWSYGVYVGRCEKDCLSGRLRSLTLNENAITGNTVGMGTELTLPLNAERNWWGSARGPQVASNPGGDGQPVVGATIDYVPWLCDGTDAQPSQIGFQPVSGAATCTNAPTRLRFTVQPPTTAYTNEPFDPQPAVRVEDAQGNLAINYDNAILIALANNPAGGTLGGTLTADPVNGVATFTNLFLNKAGTGYRLLATSGNLYAAYSNFFTVVDPSADLSLSLSAPGSVNAGSDFAYTLTVSNAGPKPAQSLTLTLNLPAGVTYQSASGSGWTCGHSAGVVTCTAASLASGANTIVTVNVSAPAQAGPITATASVSAASPTDPTPANNSTSAETTVVALPPTGGVQIYLPLIMR